MDTWQLVLALLVIAGYVLKHILTTQQERQKTQPREERAAQPASAIEAGKTDEETARAKTELDRRIEDAFERRREVDETPAKSPLPKRSIPMPKVVVATVPRYQPATRIGRTKPPPVVLAVAEVPAPTSPPVVLPVAATVAVKPDSHAVRQVIELLQNRRSLAAVVVLREVLDRPLSRRHRRS